MDAVAVIDGADSYLHELRTRCNPGGDLARLDAILAGRIALLSDRLLAELARLLARVRPAEPPCELEAFAPFRERWVSATGEGLALTRDGRLVRRGVTGPWAVVRHDADKLDLHQIIQDESAKRWRKIDLNLEGVESLAFREATPELNPRHGRRGES